MKKLVAVLFALLAVVAPCHGDERANPEAAAGVKPGDTGVLASWWGFDAEDSTSFLQSAIDSGAKEVIVPYMGQPWIVRPINLRSNLTLRFEPGVLVLAKRGEFKEGGDSLFSASDAENITVIGYGATLRMWKTDYQKPPYKKAEWRMTLDFCGCKNVLVEGVRCESSGGDGIYVGCTDKRLHCEDFTVRNVICHDHHRQGISVIGAKNLLIENCVLSSTRGTPPAAGIDFEPNRDDEVLTNCVMRNCLIEDNSGAGILFYLKNQRRNTEPVSITVQNCLVRGGKDAGIGIGGLGDGGVTGEIRIEGCTITGCRRAGAYIYNKAVDSAAVRFVNCNWSDVAANDKMYPLLIHCREPKYCSSIGGLEFVDCTMHDARDRPVIFFETKGDMTLKAVKGTIAVVNPHGARAKIPMPQEGCALNVVDIRGK